MELVDKHRYSCVPLAGEDDLFATSRIDNEPVTPMGHPHNSATVESSSGPSENDLRHITALPTLPPHLRSDSTLGMFDGVAAAMHARRQLDPHHKEQKTGVPLPEEQGARDSEAHLLCSSHRRHREPTQRLKWLQALLLCLLASCITMAASVLDNSMQTAVEVFKAPVQVSVLAAPVFLLGQAMGPFTWGWCIRRVGRTACLSLGFAAFVAFQAPIIAAKGVATILVLRFFAGLSGCAPLLTIFSQLTELLGSTVDSGIAISILSGFLIAGPIAGRMIGTFVTESALLGWRWPSVIMAATSAFVGLACWLSYMRPSRCIHWLRVRRPQKIYDPSTEPIQNIDEPFESKDGYSWNTTRMLLTQPAMLMVTMYTSFVYGLIFFIINTYPLSFADDRNWNTGQSVVPLVSVLVGVTSGCVLNFICSYDQFVKPIALRRRIEPEEQLRLMVFGAFLLPIGLFVFSWTSLAKLSPVPQVMAGTPLGMGIVLVFLKGNDHLPQVHANADSVMAINTIFRSLIAAAFAGFSKYMYKQMTLQRIGTVMALISLLFVSIPVLLIKSGARIRKSSELREQERTQSADPS